jgi:hypothetical protein
MVNRKSSKGCEWLIVNGRKAAEGKAHGAWSREQWFHLYLPLTITDSRFTAFASMLFAIHYGNLSVTV